ncbi:MAG: hypothetical protein K1X35_00800 [Caulobacteraceae bacterium]|nr:hypothetical protein [Caulobacteraceae bacterium]
MRVLGILSCIAIVAATPALAGPYESWVTLPVNQQGQNGSYDVGTIHIQGSWRTIRMRFDNPANAGRPSDIWVRVDCSSAAVQVIGEFNANGEPVPAGDWSASAPGSMGSIIRDGVCNR